LGMQGKVCIKIYVYGEIKPALGWLEFSGL